MIDISEELTESFLNGNISYVMEALGDMQNFEAMMVAIRVYENLNTHQKHSFCKSIVDRISI